jgi:hypothetical protein
MNQQEILTQYVAICHKNLPQHDRVLKLLKNEGLYEPFIFDNFMIGYADGSLLQSIGENREIIEKLTEIGLVKNGKEVLTKSVVIPIFDEYKGIHNLSFYSPWPQSKSRFQFLNDTGLFNAHFLKNNSDIILTDNPLHALLLIQHSYSSTTFLTGDDNRFIQFCKQYYIQNVTFTFDGKASLFYELTRMGIATRRLPIDFEQVKTTGSSDYLMAQFSDSATDESVDSNDVIRQIENGFLFQFPHLSYRVIGNFTDNSMHLRVNIKAFTDNEVFMDAVDLYKNRNRQTFIYNLMDKFAIRDQVQLEHDLNRIIEVIENYKEKQQQDNKQAKPELTDYQKDIGTRFLTSSDLIEQIANDITRLGYVREDKNKILMYLLMTSRLLDNPLHAVIISRSGAGKSGIVDVVEKLCPPEELVSVSDLSPQSLFYYGEDDLKHRFIVIGEKEGSKGSDYPLRELISKKSITKAIPMKDQTTGQIKTVSIRVNGPIALAETTTNGEINPENLNRCFVIGIDESEEQTRLIHHNQRLRYTLDGHLNKKEVTKIIDKHIYAQRLLRKIHVFNPYAPLLTFPSSRLQTRRDNDKLLKLISVICFLHQYQRQLKTHKAGHNDIIEYIEATPDDYRIAYDLLSDGVLDNTLDDLPRPARELLDVIKKYLQQKSVADDIPMDKIIFERKQIREFSSWSFARCATTSASSSTTNTSNCSSPRTAWPTSIN